MSDSTKNVTEIHPTTGWHCLPWIVLGERDDSVSMPS